MLNKEQVKQVHIIYDHWYSLVNEIGFTIDEAWLIQDLIDSFDDNNILIAIEIFKTKYKFDENE